MDLDLRFFATFREAVGDKERTRHYDADLEASYEGLQGELLADGRVRDQLSVLKNGRDVVHMENADTVLEPGDTLSVFPPVAGG
jgi:molybdopterin synthase sulfur carrier subunit